MREDERGGVKQGELSDPNSSLTLRGGEGKSWGWACPRLPGSLRRLRQGHWASWNASWASAEPVWPRNGAAWYLKVLIRILSLTKLYPGPLKLFLN